MRKNEGVGGMRYRIKKLKQELKKKKNAKLM